MKFFVLFGLLLNCFNAIASSELKVLESYTISVTEISGMAWRKNPKTKAQELVIVCDNEYALYVLKWPQSSSNLKVNRVDFEYLRRKGEGKQSEWESVFSDDSGRIFIIKENPARILVISADLKKLVQTINLEKHSSVKGDNSGGEGIFPLANGHVLVVNEKNPLMVIEYGPKKSKAGGYSSNLSIERNGNFPLSSMQNDLSVLHTWRVEKESQKLLQDSSGLNVDMTGNLYLLSDENRLIGLLGNELSTSVNIFKVSKHWTLPKVVRRPEGMVIDQKNRPIIAVDKKKAKKPNLFLLSELK